MEVWRLYTSHKNLTKPLYNNSTKKIFSIIHYNELYAGVGGGCLLLVHIQYNVYIYKLRTQ